MKERKKKLVIQIFLKDYSKLFLLISFKTFSSLNYHAFHLIS